MKKNIYFVSILLLGIFLIILGTSYALFTKSVTGEKNLVFETGTFSVTFEELGDVIQFSNAYPMTEQEGMKTKEYLFQVNNVGERVASYKIYLEEDSTVTNPVSKDKLKVAWKKNGGSYTTPVFLSELEKMTLESNVGLASSLKDQYAVRLWLDESATNEQQGKKFKARIVVEATQVVSADKTLASAPELESNMIPVTYDEASKNWIKADVTNPESNPWYKYQDKMWANAVVVKETGTKTRTEYLNSAAGTPISMDDILQMLVWVPRYKYTIGTESTPMNIIFEDKSTAKSTGTATGVSYLTHPAFTFGTTELNGIWVAKFEPTADITCTTANGSIGTGCDLTTMKPTIKPNQLIWTGARISTFFTVARNMQVTGNIYGYNTIRVNTRVARNEEWGATAYLTHSIYGRCTGNTCEEVTINNISTEDARGITGCAGDTVSAPQVINSSCPETNQYNTEKGVKASTTGNVYGIYDMSGGDWEFVMANLNGMSGNSLSSNSGFTGINNDGSKTAGLPWPEGKYLTVFSTKIPVTACNGEICYGQALSETAGWNTDSTTFVTEASPWLVRSVRASGTETAGIFAFGYAYGFSYTTVSFRFVVSKE